MIRRPDRRNRAAARGSPGAHEAMLTNPAVDASGSDQAGIHRLQPRDPFGSVTIHRQGVFAPGGDHRWMGSLAMDGAGAIALGYSVSSPTTFPSIRSTARPPGAC